VRERTPRGLARSLFAHQLRQLLRLEAFLGLGVGRHALLAAALAGELLDWVPRTSLKDGLVPTIGYFDKLLGDPKVRASLMAGQAGD